MRILSRLPSHPSITTRILILLGMVVILGFLSLHVTGSLFPSDQVHSLVFQSGLLVAVFGSLVLEDKFTKPADALVNATFVLMSLLPLFSRQMDFLLCLLVIYTAIVLLAGLTNLILLNRNVQKGLLSFVRELTYSISTTLGKSTLIHSFLFLYAVHAFNTSGQSYAELLLVFWAVHLAMWPLKLPHLLDALIKRSRMSRICGVIVRVEVPNILKVKLERQASWAGGMFASLGDGSTRRILPLYTQLQGEDVIGTGIIGDTVQLDGVRTIAGVVYTASDSDSTTDTATEAIGIVCEGSRIATIRFETWKHELLREGLLVYFLLDEERIYYQVSDALTKQESFESNRHGFQVVEADQLGTYHGREGFKKYSWLPEVNTPIFVADKNIQGIEIVSRGHELALGTVPGTDVTVFCDINKIISHHSAILGVTGSGKTELAFRVIQRAIENKVKVFCVDITDQYSARLERFNPIELSIAKDLADKLGQKLHDAETGDYGAGKEKKVLKEFTDRLRKDIDQRVLDFVKGSDYLGIFSLPSISNTQATIQATEIYLTSLFRYNRMNAANGTRVLVVLEEAHTVVPETSTMGLGDFDSKGMVAKIAQIALQGRKYEVGLLVIAQRTATVSKTVLTQCNTVISFSSFDKTGLDFLSNIYGAEQTSKISNLRPFHCLAFGKGVNSERPIVIQMPPLEMREGEPVAGQDTVES